MMDIDLNLLRIFDSCMTSATSPGQRLVFSSRSQRSVMRSRGQGGARRSAVRAHSLRLAANGAARTSLRHDCALRWPRSAARFATPIFDPAKTRQRFVIAAGSYFCMLIVPSLIALGAQICAGHHLADRHISADVAQAPTAAGSISH